MTNDLPVTDCPHGGDAAICPPCNPLPAATRRERRVTVARWEGTCPACPDLIELGDEIVVDVDSRLWIHARCCEELA